MPHPTVIEGTQVMTMDEGSQIQALTVYQASLGSEFDIDPGDDTFNKGPKPIEELVQLQLKPKLGQCMHLNRDLTSHKHRRITDMLRRNMNLFAWQPSDMLGIHPNIICHKLTISP